MESDARRLAVLLALVGMFAIEVAPPAAAHHSQLRGRRTAEGRALLVAVRRNPRIATKPWFLHKAGLFGVDLPVTIRLTPTVDQAGTPSPLNDDAIQIGLDAAPTAAPLPAGVTAGTVTSTLNGTFAASLRFSQDTAGYGQDGIVELGFGKVALTGTGFDLVENAAPATCPALLKTADAIAIRDAPGSVGYVNLFSGVFSIDLHVAFQFASQTRSSCADPYTTTSVMDGTGRPPLPIRIDGGFRISPALTADGHVRLGKLTLRGPQQSSFVQVHTCTVAPPPSTCAAGGDGSLTGRLTTTTFGAEMLVGSV